MLNGKNILLIVTGGIAAYKSLELVRILRSRGCSVRCILTKSGREFITPLSLAALSGQKVYEDLFSLTDESEMGHIRLAGDADLILVAPATANILAKTACGIADDLATTVLLAADGPVMTAPAMNVKMWKNPATRANLETLKRRGVLQVGPEEGEMACGETGMGRMAEPAAIAAAVERCLQGVGRLSGKSALVTSGPTHEAIDPVRYIANRSSGKQGHAIAEALARMGAETILVSGPTHEPDPSGVLVLRVKSAREMLAACEKALPVDVAVCAAAVADWRPAAPSAAKIKKNGKTRTFELAENPDILAALSVPGNRRPKLVIGFAAETDAVIDNAHVKLAAKGCDWIVANDVSPSTGIIGGESNTVHLITANGKTESWPAMPKPAVAERLAILIADALEQTR
ncbi:MAG: bifunctional phosphopantothenoylcysteine decarboxylase/phosphopantothenate synthase [Rhodospirillales bacterium RIFCSPLOWO2_12_FULL_58_28]|nr:MAG: bifunctional phosphopantothenoylcysteine decarboxylase/phosphopantothenate synthase [Rhodospirillales bacterium RIFCSPLOWO2_02_FULL_58_16]OHC77880.1 MAG: bifunctional phosphopantothenoylcysteine decarboxylase/phosphopantothenate synthase [Rhodospirillales bacterium RIFCSPLOWO2_12_FULL_58_28]